MSTASDIRSGLAETVEERTAALRAIFESDPPPMVTRSIEAFRRDLPELLKTRRGQWAAYHGDECLGFGRRKTPLYHQCLSRGLSRDEFIVWAVDPSTFDDDVTATPDL